MSDQIKDIVVPILKTMQADISVLKESVRRIDSRIATMDSYMSGFYGSLRWQGDEIDQHRGRLEALEEQNKPVPPSE